MDLWNLKPDQVGLVTNLSLENFAVKDRLVELGLRVGQVVECIHWSPLGGPRTYQVTSGVFAMEKDIAEDIQVEAEGYTCDL